MPVPDDPDASPLGVISSALVLSGGGVALIDRQQQRVLVYEDDGRQRLNLGGRGFAPGEFQAAASLEETASGTLMVYDSRLGRLTEFGPDGTLVGVTTLPRDMFPRPPSQTWRVGDGRLLAWEFNIGDGGVLARTNAAERWGARGVLRLIDLATSSADTLREAPAWETIREGSRMWVAPFAPVAGVTVLGRSVFFTTGQEHALEVFDLETSSRQRFEFPARDGPVDQALLRSLEAEGRAQSAVDGVPFEAGVIFNPALQPTLRPAFDGLLVDEAGTIWAKRYEPFRAGTESWWLISPAGVFRGLVELPPCCRLLSFGARVMVVLHRDEFDVPSVELWPYPDAVIQGPGAG